MKHLVRLYPKRWRDRYGAEIGAFLERQRFSVAGLLDLLRGAADAHLHPALASQLVFVPTIGFRPSGTRTLLERAETSVGDTHLAIRAVAATPERTELIVEWEQTLDPVMCALPDATTAATTSGEIGAPPKRPPSLMAPPEQRLSAVIAAGSAVVEATSLQRTTHITVDGGGWWAMRSMLFPALPSGTERAELRVSDGERRWIIPFRLVPARIAAAPVACEATRDGITARVTAATRDDDQLVLAVEVSAAHTIRRVGAPAEAMPILPSGRKFKVMRGAGFEPLVLEDERGGRVEEIRRIFPLRDLPEPEPVAQRFSVYFAAPSRGARRATLLVPFVEIIDRTPSAVVDLRRLPIDVDLAGQRIRVTRADAYPGSDHWSVQMEIPPSSASPRFVHPAAIHGAPGGSYSWSGEPERGEPFRMETAVGDPPLVTLSGAVLRYDGPWRLEFELAWPDGLS